MNTAHAIVGHVVLIPLVLALLAAVVYAAFHLDVGEHGRLSDPLDPELVRRWNAHAH
jgi:hypothetical protein